MAKGGFRGGYGGGQANMMKQAQKMQQDFLKMQQELESTKFEFSAGGGADDHSFIVFQHAEPRLNIGGGILEG